MTRYFIGCGMPCTPRWKALLFTFFFTQSLFSFSQDFKPKFGQVDKASVEMTADPSDSTAEAVYLYDYGDVRYTYDEQRGIMMMMDTWVRIKILKESALNRASVALVFADGGTYDKREMIEAIKGFTYNLEGDRIVVSELDKKSVKREKSSDTYNTLRFNLPNVKKGSVIEYAYTRTTPMQLKDAPEPWTFQASIPSRWSEFRIVVPYFLEYKMTMGGYVPLDINQQETVPVNVGHSKFDGPGRSYRLVVKNAPAFINEPFITTERDYVCMIRFELSSLQIPGETLQNFSRSWKDVDETLNMVGWFGGELRKSSYLKPVRDEIAAKTTNPTERMNLAYAWVQNNMKWDGYSGLGSGEGVKKAFDNKKGNASDINFILTTLLRELDLQSDPVVLSTRSHGRINKSIPLLESFNYVISYVTIEDKEYVLDATQQYAKPGMLPEHALNGFGRIIRKNGTGDFMELKPRDTQSKLEIITATIAPEDGSIKGTYSISYGGYEALNWRGKYGASAETSFHNDLKKTLPEWTVENIRINNKTADLNGSVGVDCDFEIENDNPAPDVFYFNPILAGRWLSNPLKTNERIYPLDLTTGISAMFVGKFTLPEGYVIEEMPKQEMVTLPDKGGRFVYQVQQRGNVVDVKSSVIVSQTNFLPEEYGNLKEFFERIVQKHAQPLVIKRKIN